jgi:hypothetical protein
MKRRRDSEGEDTPNFDLGGVSSDIVGDTISGVNLCQALGIPWLDGSVQKRFFTPPRAAVPRQYFHLLASALDENENLYWDPSDGKPSWDHMRRVQAVDTVSNDPEFPETS